MKASLAERAAANAARLARYPAPVHRRDFAAIDAGMVQFIMELTQCAYDQVPEKLREWLETGAKGSGTR